MPFVIKIGAVSGIRTRVMSLEGSGARPLHYDRFFFIDLVVYLKLSLSHTTMLKR